MKIIELCDVYDCLHVTPEYENDGIPMVRVTEVSNSFLNLATTMRVSYQNYKKYAAKHIPKREDIILARVGAFLGEFAFVDTDEMFCIGQNTTILSPHKNGRYIFYNLISPVTQKRIKTDAAGSAYKSVGVDAIKNFEIDYPGDDAAQKIGNILYTIDEKISVNHHINDNLAAQS